MPAAHEKNIKMKAIQGFDLGLGGVYNVNRWQIRDLRGNITSPSDLDSFIYFWIELI